MIDLTPWLDTVPTAVVDRLRNARNVLAVGHENPDADTLGATLAVCRLVERAGGTATAVFADPVPPLYDFLPDVQRARTDPEPDAAYDLLVVSDCGTLDRIGAVRDRHPELFERLPRLVIDHHASNDAVGEHDWIEPDAARKVAITAAAKMKPLPRDENNPLAGDVTPDNLILWLAYTEAKALIKFDAAPPPKAVNDKK